MAPNQGDEGAPEAWLVLDVGMLPAMRDLQVGDEIIVLTWLHLARRDELLVHPRGDPDRAAAGVFNTRSPNRPNPIGLHQVTILQIHGTTILVRSLEAVDHTPIIDIKPVLGPRESR